MPVLDILLSWFYTAWVSCMAYNYIVRCSPTQFIQQLHICGCPADNPCHPTVLRWHLGKLHEGVCQRIHTQIVLPYLHIPMVPMVWKDVVSYAIIKNYCCRQATFWTPCVESYWSVTSSGPDPNGNGRQQIGMAQLGKKLVRWLDDPCRLAVSNCCGPTLLSMVVISSQFVKLITWLGGLTVICDKPSGLYTCTLNKTSWCSC